MPSFRDPIHGFIEVSDDEARIIDSAPFQRLRHIKQLSTTYMVYHGAEHTRFGHSLGVMHLTSRVFDSIISKNPHLFDKPTTAYYRQILRIVGLTHDVGHAPFSHGSEDLFPDGMEHEDYTKKIIFETEIREHIERIGEHFQDEHGDGFPITPEVIWLAYTGANPVDPLYRSDFQFLKSLMDGELDCDKMDYLLRDSHYCGVQYGTYDLRRLIDSFTVYQDDENSSPRLAILSDGVQAVEEFILARYFMFIQVYYHKTRRFLDFRLLECMKALLPEGVYPKDVDEYLAWDDDRVMEGALASESPAAMNFLRRKTMSCVFSTDAHTGKSDEKLYRLATEKVESFLDKEGISPGTHHEHIFMDEAKKDVHKIELDPLDERGIPVIHEHKSDPYSILEASLLLNSLKGNEIAIYRLYASNEYKKQIVDLVSDYL